MSDPILPSESARLRTPRVRESARSLREKYAGFCSNYGAKGPELYVRKMCEQLGLIDNRGNAFWDAKRGWITLNPNRTLDAGSIDLMHFTEAVLGPEWRTYLDPQQGGNSFLDQAWLRENTAPAVGPSALANVTAWKAGIAGLLQAIVLEALDMPEFVLAQLAGTLPAGQGTPPNQRLIGVVPSGLPAPEFDPQQGHPKTKLDDMFIYTARPKLKGNGIFVNKLTAVHDITGGEIVRKASEVGYTIALANELDFIHLLTGLLNNFSMGFTADSAATAYNTYNATAVDFTSYFYVNSHVNPITDYRNLGINRQLFFKMRHPVNRTPIAVPASATTAICADPVVAAQLAEANAVQTMRRYDNSGTAGSKQPGVAYMGPQPNPYGGSVGKIVESQWLQTVFLATSATPSESNPIGGLGLTDGTTAMRWYHGDYSRMIKKRGWWNVAPINVNPNEYTAANNLLEFGLLVNEYYHYQVCSPWHGLECKQS